jgi:hypothetical protein
MEKLNIISIIENNPIKALSAGCNCRLINKVKEQFTEIQQQNFIASFYCYLNYHPTNDFIISLDDIWQWLGFSQKIRAKELLERHFTRDLHYKISTYHEIKNFSPARNRIINGKGSYGGKNKEQIMMNLKTFKLLCIKANTTKSNELHEYYVLLEQIITETIKEECEEMNKILQKSNEINAQKIIEIKEDANIKIHNKLIQIHHKKNVVYLCKIKDHENGKFIIKIGSTQNIKERMANIKNTYIANPVVMEIFECNHHVQFENWIRSYPSIKHLYFPLKKNNDCFAKETFLVNEEECRSIVQVIKEELKKIQDNAEMADLEKKIEYEHAMRARIEMDLKRLEIEKVIVETEKETGITELKNNEIKLKMMEICKIENTPIPPEIIPVVPVIRAPYIKKRENTRSPKVYKYDPVTYEHIQTYDSIIEVMRTFDGSAAPTTLKTAAKNNVVFRNYRWAIADRNIMEIPDIKPTENMRTQTVEYIAMIDIKQTKIMEVFPSQKDAAMSRNLAGFSTISRAIKQNSLSSGHYWNIFERCPENMKAEYLTTNTLPERHLATTGTKVAQIDPLTNKEIMTYNSIMEMLKQHQMSRITLKKISGTDIIHNGFLWRILDN